MPFFFPSACVAYLAFYTTWILSPLPTRDKIQFPSEAAKPKLGNGKGGIKKKGKLLLDRSLSISEPLGGSYLSLYRNTPKIMTHLTASFPYLPCYSSRTWYQTPHKQKKQKKHKKVHTYRTRCKACRHASAGPEKNSVRCHSSARKCFQTTQPKTTTSTRLFQKKVPDLVIQ